MNKQRYITPSFTVLQAKVPTRFTIHDILSTALTSTAGSHHLPLTSQETPCHSVFCARQTNPDNPDNYNDTLSQRREIPDYEKDAVHPK